MKFKIFFAFLFTTYNSLSQEATAVRVIDGDTFVTEQNEKVRLIGINAPELKDVFGYESKEYLIKLIEGKAISLTRDSLSSDKDRYGRLLRYAFIDGVDVNKKMIQEGFAFAYLTYKFEKQHEYENEQLKSKGLKKGIWGDAETRQDNSIDKTFSIKNLSVKAYIVCGLIIGLLLIGFYSYFRR